MITSRGRSSGNGLRDGRCRDFATARLEGGCAASASACAASSAACAVSNSSSRNSSCSSCAVSFSLFLPKIMRRYFSMTSLKCSISSASDLCCSIDSLCLAIRSAFNASTSS